MQFRTRIEKAVKPHAVILITLFALIISMSFIAPNFLSVEESICDKVDIVVLRRYFFI